jgi:hypothetical protein
MLRALRNQRDIVCFLLLAVPHVATRSMGLVRWCISYIVSIVPVRFSKSRLQAPYTCSASYLLILTYDKSSASADHITITHFTIGLISPVPNIGESYTETNDL